MISIVMPVYNMPADYISLAIDSVKFQTCSDWELVLVNDGSTDETLRILHPYQIRDSDRISVISKPNGGVASALNRGICAAVGNYILILSSDDAIDNTFLEKMLAILEVHPEVDIAGCDTQVFDASNETYYTQPLSFDTELSDNQMNYCSLMRRSVFDTVGLFDENMRGYEDWEFWIRCAKAGLKSIKLSEFLFLYRHKSGGGLYQECVNQHHAALLEYIRSKHPEVRY